MSFTKEVLPPRKALDPRDLARMRQARARDRAARALVIGVFVIGEVLALLLLLPGTCA